MTKEFLKGVIPSDKFKECQVHKSAKNGQKSFRVTSALLSNIYNKAKKVGKTGFLILTIPANKEESYKLTCKITKEKN